MKKGKKMIEENVEVKIDIGLHSKPGACFANKAKEYKSSIQISKNGEQADAKNLLEILSLGIMGGNKIKILANGIDEEEAIEGLKKLLNELG